MMTRGKATELLAYIAGITDGEGCINLYGSRSAYNYAPRVSITNSSVELMELLKEEFGGSVTVMRDGTHPDHPRKTYSWYLGYRNVGPFLYQIYPYLLIKKRQARLVLMYLKTIPEGNTRACEVSPKTAAIRQKIYAEIKELNGYRSHPQRLSETTSGPDEAIVCSASKDAEASGTETTGPIQ